MVSTNFPGQRPPLDLSGQALAPKQKKYAADFLINGLPFLLGPSDNDPYIHTITEDQKDQFDASQEAGEQSFGYWWLRAQSTFHGGQGEKFLDSGGQQPGDSSRLRFWSSSMVNPHVPGELSLHGTLTKTSAPVSRVVQVTWNGVEKLVELSSTGHTITIVDLPSMALEGTYTVGAGGIGVAMTTDGVDVWIAINDGVWRVTPNSSGPPTITNTHAVSLSGTVCIGYAKQRLMLSIGRVLYALDPNPVSPPYTVTSTDIFYTNPAANYVYTCFSDGPNSIWATGYSGPRSNVTSITVAVDTSTGVTLDGPVEQFTTPPGEIVYSIMSYVHGIFIMATSLGARVGQYTIYGQPQPGELLVRRPCYSISASGTLIYVGAQDSIWVIDLSTAIDQTGYYAHWMYTDGLGTNSGDGVSSITVLAGNWVTPDLVFGCTQSGNLVSQPSYAPTKAGTLTTGWMRFDTTEPKRLHYIAIDGTFPVVSGVPSVCDVTVMSLAGQSQTFQIPGGQTHYEFGVSGIDSDQKYQVTFTLHDTGSGHGVTLNSWQLKALPSERLFEEYTLPLQCFDSESDATGGQYGYTGYAKERLYKLEALVGTNQVVTVSDFRNNISFQAHVRQMQFKQINMPTIQQPVGGLITLTLRTV